MVYGIMKTVHIIAFASVAMGLGALAFHGLNGGTKENNNARLWALITHGASLIVLFVTGFGLLGVLKLSSFPFPLWVWLKLVLVLVAGGVVALFLRKTELAKVWWFSVPVLIGVAAVLAIFKPGSP